MSELGVSSINPSGCPRFPAYSVGHLYFAPQSNPTGLNPRVPWGPAMGTPRGPPPGIPLRYSQVVPVRGKKIDSPVSVNTTYRYRNEEGSTSPDKFRVLNELPKVFPYMEVMVPGKSQGNSAPLEEKLMVPDESETNLGDNVTPNENRPLRDRG